MVTSLNDASLFKNDDAVTVLDRGETVGDNEGCTSCHQFIHTILHDTLRTGIDRACCLVEDQYRRIGDRCTCDGEHLALSLAEIRTISGEDRVVTVRKLADEGVCVRKSCSSVDFLIGCIKFSVADVIHNRSGKQVGIL